MRKITHAEVIEYCELRGIDHTDNENYNRAKDDIEVLLKWDKNVGKTIKELVASVEN